MAVLTQQQVTDVAYSAGFRGTALQTAVAIAHAESGFNSTAYNPESAAGTPIGSGSRGLWQVYGKAHPEYNNDGTYDPATNANAAYRISGNGSSFGPWSTFTNGQYLQFMNTVSGGAASVGSTVQQAAANTYPLGQCTWWACERYKQLSGYYISWKGNAQDWPSLARSATGWVVSAQPQQGCIIVLSNGVQLSDSTYGHVAIVEKVNANGSLSCSNQNWAGITYPNVKYTTFYAGAGVSFIWASGAGGSTGGATSGPDGAGALGISLGTSPTFQLISDAHKNMPGFHGLALVLDDVEHFNGYHNVATSNVDVVGIIRSIGLTVSDNAIPALVRGSLVLLGVFLVCLLLIALVKSEITVALGDVVKGLA